MPAHLNIMHAVWQIPTILDTKYQLGTILDIDIIGMLEIHGQFCFAFLLFVVSPTTGPLLQEYVFIYVPFKLPPTATHNLPIVSSREELCAQSGGTPEQYHNARV